jgi:hypothetical protein
MITLLSLTVLDDDYRRRTEAWIKTTGWQKSQTVVFLLINSAHIRWQSF